MSDRSPTFAAGRRAVAATPPAPTPVPEAASLLNATAAGQHDDALVRLVAGHLVSDAESKLWADARFVAWWAEEQRARARAVPDEAYLADGLALRARVQARRLGIVRHEARPSLRLADVVAAPGQVFDEAARVHATPVVDLAVAAGVGRELWDEPVETWLELPAGLPAGRYLALRINGDSMEPAMATGDLALVALGTQPKAGLAVVARHPEDGYVCKRVRRVRGATIELESLAPDRPIITLPRDDELVLGVVVAVWAGW
jgi:SOS-response transcriptional repressor LexA